MVAWSFSSVMLYERGNGVTLLPKTRFIDSQLTGEFWESRAIDLHHCNQCRQLMAYDELILIALIIWTTISVTTSFKNWSNDLINNSQGKKWNESFHLVDLGSKTSKNWNSTQACSLRYEIYSVLFEPTRNSTQQHDGHLCSGRIDIKFRIYCELLVTLNF